MAEYVERELIYSDFEKCNDNNPKWTPGRVKTLISRQPAADVAPVVHGRWIKEKNREDFDSMKCTACNGLLLVRWHTRLDFFRYCPNCGARMDLEENNGKSQNVWYDQKGDSK